MIYIILDKSMPGLTNSSAKIYYSGVYILRPSNISRTFDCLSPILFYVRLAL